MSLETDCRFEISGVYVMHWEVARFVVVNGRRFFGLFPAVEKWRPHFPEDFKFPGDKSPLGRSGVRYYRMKVIGILGEPGRFGHMGICKREVFIEQVLECDETHNPGPTW